MCGTKAVSFKPISGNSGGCWCTILSVYFVPVYSLCACNHILIDCELNLIND